MFKFNNKDTRNDVSNIFIIKFEHILHPFLSFLLLTLQR